MEVHTHRRFMVSYVHIIIIIIIMIELHVRPQRIS